jgi:Xaa-Pro aminopeptidase
LTEIEQRQRAVATQLSERKIDAILISSPANVRYLSLYAGSNGMMLITPLETHFFTDPRYALAVETVPGKVHIAKGSLIETVAAVIKRKRLKKIGFEAAWLSFETYSKLKDAVALGRTLVPAGPLVEELRTVKSPAEIEQIRRSVDANSEAYLHTMRRIKLGVREQDIAAELEFQMRMKGAEKAAFETIVAAGVRTALPHAHPTAHRLGANELLLIDMGANLGGYASDMTRVAFTGTPPKEIRELYRAVLEAQLSAIDAVRAGAATSAVDGAARKVLKKHKLDRAFVHSTGHGLGLEIHEAPRIARKDKTKLRTGMTITIEPGAYIGGLGGIRIEDTVLVTDKGCEVLTPTSKEFLTL